MKQSPWWLVAALGVSGCAGWCSSGSESQERRVLEEVALGDATVVLGVELAHDFTGASLTASGSGRGALPDGVRGPRHWWRPRPSIAVRRGDGALVLEERHPNPRTWYRIGEPHDAVEGAREAAEEVTATHCQEDDRLVYRLASEGYDSGWHGVYVRGDVAIHRGVGEDPAECGEALAAFPPLADYLASLVEDAPAKGCALLSRAGEEDLAFECALRHPEAAEPDQWSAWREEVAQGPAHDPDREAQVFACLEEGRGGRQGCRRLLAATTSDDRLRAYLDSQLETCSGEGQRARCLDEPRLAAELARLGDAALCGRLYDRVEGYTRGENRAALGRAGRLSAALAECVPRERVEALARQVVFRDDRTQGQLPSCPAEPSLACPSLPQLGGALLARDCARPDVARARAHFEEEPFSVASAGADGAMRVLVACAPDDAREVIRASFASVPSQEHVLERYGLSTGADAGVTGDGGR